jgi:heat shock protein HslJ
MMTLGFRPGMAIWLFAALGCGPRPPGDRPPDADQSPPSDPPPPASTASLEGREWTLVALGEQSAPPGAGGRPATIQFDGGTGRAVGFAGCNRYSGRYTVAGASLTFGPAVSTKMACTDGDELERSYLAILPRVTSYTVSDTGLILDGSAGPLARFRAP